MGDGGGEEQLPLCRGSCLHGGGHGKFLSGLVWPPLAVSSASLLAGLSIVNKLLFSVVCKLCAGRNHVFTYKSCIHNYKCFSNDLSIYAFVWVVKFVY